MQHTREEGAKVLMSHRLKSIYLELWSQRTTLTLSPAAGLPCTCICPESRLSLPAATTTARTGSQSTYCPESEPHLPGIATTHSTPTPSRATAHLHMPSGRVFATHCHCCYPCLSTLPKDWGSTHTAHYSLWPYVTLESLRIGPPRLALHPPVPKPSTWGPKGYPILSVTHMKTQTNRGPINSPRTPAAAGTLSYLPEAWGPGLPRSPKLMLMWTNRAPENRPIPSVPQAHHLGAWDHTTPTVALGVQAHKQRT